MKKAYLFIAAVSMFAIGCDKIEDLAKIEKDLDFTQTVDVPGLPNGADSLAQGQVVRGDFPIMAIETKSKEFLEGEGSAANPDAVEHVKLSKFKASVLMPANGDFDYVDSIYVFLSAKGLSEIKIASKTSVAKGSKSIDFDCNSDNLKEYFLKDTMYVRMGGKFVGAPDSGSRLEIKPTFNVKANLLKAAK
ncbi:MAG: hypothetical protein EOP56_18010 [Sphingobacteriales bacterium]|nr:MAG: hypothetical protein EOP56_18010 [Sphingobacteriales bacterium]